MPIQQSPGATTLTGNAILGYRFALAVSAIKLYLKTGMLTTRGATPTTLRAIATEYSGKPYARSRKGLEKALADLETLGNGKDLDQIGEVAVVNKEVGGVAADLADATTHTECGQCGKGFENTVIFEPSTDKAYCSRACWKLGKAGAA